MAGSKKKKAVRRGLNRKQFLLGLVVVCGAALIIECALLIHTFSKKKEKPKENTTPTPTAAVAEQTQPTEIPKPTPGEPWGYTMKSYDCNGGGRELVYSVLRDYDEWGRKTRQYTWSRYEAMGRATEDDCTYFYDEGGRMLSESRVIMDGHGNAATRYYDHYYYKEEDGRLLVAKETHGANDDVVNVEESIYDEQGRLVQISSGIDGRMVGVEARKYDDFGNLIERTMLEKGVMGLDEPVIRYNSQEDKTYRTDRREGRTEAWSYDEQGRLRLVESYYDGELNGTFSFVYNGDGRICRKRLMYDSKGVLCVENEYDETGLPVSHKVFSAGEQVIGVEYDWTVEYAPLKAFKKAKETYLSGFTRWVIAYDYREDLAQGEFTPLSCFDVSKNSLECPYLTTEGAVMFLEISDDQITVETDGRVTIRDGAYVYTFDSLGRLLSKKIPIEDGGRLYEYSYH